jgi:hypothetical protein
MKKTILFGLLLLAMACKDDKEPLSKTDLLIGSWYYTAESPDDSDCPVTEAFIQDDNHIFSADGTYVYDHGAVTESGKCSNIIAMVGKWKFQDNESKLLVTIEYSPEFPNRTDDLKGDTLLYATIKSLTADKLMLTEGGFEATMTKRK